MFTKKEKKDAKRILKIVKNGKWVQRSCLGNLYILDNHQDILVEINKKMFESVGNGETWSLKDIVGDSIK